MHKNAPRRVIGLMSGTSMDGIDAALVEVHGTGSTLTARLLDFRCLPLEPVLRQRVQAASAGAADIQEVARLNFALGEAFAAAANVLITAHGKVDLIGSHGQTVCHLPAEGVTLQLGEPCIIAERTGTTVVADFRPRDMAAGGQGAPLVPYVDWVLLRSPTSHRIVQNIGGIGNCTWLPAGCQIQEVRAWDTGPGNMLIDAVARALLGQDQDTDGAGAALGQVHEGLLQELLQHPYFAAPPPKTAGHEQFGTTFAAQFLGRCQVLGLEAPAALATATALSARSMARSYRDFGPFPGDDLEIIVGGGGAFNPTLMRLLQQEVKPARVIKHENVGLRSDAKEALAFALLAHETIQGVPTALPGATGARHPSILGKIIAGPNLAQL